MLRWLLVVAVAVGIVCCRPAAAQADTARSIAHYIMGLSYELQDQPEAAAREYRQAASADPSSFAVHMRLGAVNVQLGERRGAIKAFAAASHLEPQDLQARYFLAQVYTSVKEYDRAGEQFEKILNALTSSDPRNVEYYIFLAQLYYAQGKPGQAQAQFEKLLAVQPKNTDALLQVGLFYLEGKRRAEGIELLKRCIGIDPAHAECLNTLGYAFAEDGNHLDEAQDLVSRALAVDPKNAAYQDSLGWVYFRKGLLAKALEELQKAIAGEKDPAIYDHMGDVYEKLGQTDMALAAWRAALKMDGTLADIRSKIARLEHLPAKKP